MKKSFYLKLIISLFVSALLCASPVVPVSHADEMIKTINIWFDAEFYDTYGTFTYGNSTVIMNETSFEVTCGTDTVMASARIDWASPIEPVLATISFDYSYYPDTIGSIGFCGYDSGLNKNESHFTTTVLFSGLGDGFFVGCFLFGGHATVSNISVTTSPVPLPGPVLLLGAGLGRLAIYRRGKMTNKN
jgi:hypothetical protein